MGLRFSRCDPRRIAVVGHSQGGGVALQIASAYPADDFEMPVGLQFKAAIAFYPPCALAADQLIIPTIVLIGELDDWTPINDCQRWLDRRGGRGATVKLIVNRGAYHAFDNPDAGDGVRQFGHWLKYNPAAAERSTSEMHDFLAEELAN